MQERVTGREARQGRSGKQILILLIVSMALLIGAYVIYNLFVSAPPDRQSISALPPAHSLPVTTPTTLTG